MSMEEEEGDAEGSGVKNGFLFYSGTLKFPAAASAAWSACPTRRGKQEMGRHPCNLVSASEPHFTKSWIHIWLQAQADQAVDGGRM